MHTLKVIQFTQTVAHFKKKASISPYFIYFFFFDCILYNVLCDCMNRNTTKYKMPRAFLFCFTKYQLRVTLRFICNGHLAEVSNLHFDISRLLVLKQYRTQLVFRVTHQLLTKCTDLKTLEVNVPVDTCHQLNREMFARYSTVRAEDFRAV